MRLFALITLILVAASAWSEDEKPEYTFKTEAAVAKYNKAATKAHQEYIEAVLEAQKKLRKELEKEKDALTKKADLEGALAVKALMEEMLVHPDSENDFMAEPKDATKHTKVTFGNKRNGKALEGKIEVSLPDKHGNGNSSVLDGNSSTTWIPGGFVWKCKVTLEKPVATRTVVIVQRNSRVETISKGQVLINGVKVHDIVDWAGAPDTVAMSIRLEKTSRVETIEVVSEDGLHSPGISEIFFE